MDPGPHDSDRRHRAGDVFALVFGLFLGLALIKFGNPIILEAKISPPGSFTEFWSYPWPPSWGVWLLGVLSLAGVWLAIIGRRRWPLTRWLWILPACWFGWQLLAATRTVDGELTAATLWQFAGCVACYFIGALVLDRSRCLRLLLIGLLAAFAFCLVRAANQRLYEFPRERQSLLEGERTGWTNYPPETLLELKRDGAIVSTNGLDVANPVYVAKLAKGRVHGTLIYPNALAGAILLLLPISMVLAINGTRRFRKPTRLLVISLSALMGAAGLFWTGSKSGWLIALGLVGVWLFRLNWSRRAKITTVVVLVVVGLSVFAVRFRAYFAGGATSVGARFDYWRAAVQITKEQPVFGSGPGTFQRPYARLKSADAEMARLAHNDYLEQFSDSGVMGGISYLAWVGMILITLARRVWRASDLLYFGIFLGILGWFIQGLAEFSLYVPALSWVAFTLAGCGLRLTANGFDNKKAHG
jgi:O-antigen ligase/polysaccharide polymerase Wzy-like membrane protein